MKIKRKDVKLMKITLFDNEIIYGVFVSKSHKWIDVWKLDDHCINGRLLIRRKAIFKMTKCKMSKFMFKVLKENKEFKKINTTVDHNIVHSLNDLDMLTMINDETSVPLLVQCVSNEMYIGTIKCIGKKKFGLRLYKLNGGRFKNLHKFKYRDIYMYHIESDYGKVYQKYGK